MSIKPSVSMEVKQAIVESIVDIVAQEIVELSKYESPKTFALYTVPLDRSSDMKLLAWFVKGGDVPKDMVAFHLSREFTNDNITSCTAYFPSSFFDVACTDLERFDAVKQLIGGYGADEWIETICGITVIQTPASHPPVAMKGFRELHQLAIGTPRTFWLKNYLVDNERALVVDYLAAVDDDPNLVGLLGWFLHETLVVDTFTNFIEYIIWGVHF